MGAAAKIIPLYERHARTWFDLRRAKTFVERGWLNRFVSALPRKPGHVLDLGCGGGTPIADHLIAAGHEVTGVDSSSPTMLSICRGRHPHQAWIEADMRALSLGRRFDGILAWDSFFHLTHDDQRAMFAVFAAHAEPGATLMFTSGPGHGIAVGRLEGEELFHSSLSPKEYRKLLRLSGFAVVRHIAEDPECGGHTVWFCRRGEAGTSSSEARI